MIILFSIILTAIITGFIVYKRLEPKLIATRQLDEATAEENKKIQQTNAQLLSEKERLTTQKQSTLEQIQDLKTSIKAIEEQAQEAADLFYDTKLKAAQEKLEQSLLQERDKFQQNVENFNVQYNETIQNLMSEYKALEENVAIMRSTNNAAVEAAKRAEEMKNQLDYYRIQLTAADINEIELLRQVEPFLRDKEPLNKVIWKCYYEKPTTDMIGRVVGSNVKTGIYKITEIETGKCYVGQAANISDRWKQHIKRGVGAETPTRNKLYPAMREAGPENFTFEIVEECDRSLLDSHEDYWQEYFHAKEFGFSIK